ncbi:MAG: hypothetical protein ACTSWL_00365 [Promethearchaeota archaeon]
MNQTNDFEEVMDKDFVDFEYTKEDFENNKIGIRGSVRMALGNIYTKEEIDKLRKKVKSMKYP